MGYFRSSRGRTWKNGFRGKKRRRKQRLRALFPPATNTLGLAPSSFGEMVDQLPSANALGWILGSEIADAPPASTSLGLVLADEVFDVPPEGASLGTLLLDELHDQPPGDVSLGPVNGDEAVDYPVLPPLLKLRPGGPEPDLVDDTTGDGARIPVIMGLPGTLTIRKLHTDGYATSLELGGGVNLQRVILGTRKADGELAFRAQGASVPFSDPANTRLVGFLATSIVGAINEVREAAKSAAFPFVNGEGTALLQYEVVRPGTASGQVLRAIATTDAVAGRAIGMVKDATIDPGATGYVTTVGLTRVRLEAGLTVSAGQDLFLSSTTAGRATNVAPSTSGNVVVPLGTLTNTLAYDGALDLVVEIQAAVRAPLVVVE